MRKASKRLINAIIALVASVIFCIGICLAWFAMNTDVSGNGMQTQVKGSDIVSFEVEASYLDFFSDSNKTDFKKATDGNVSTSDKTFDKNNNGTFNVSSDSGSDSNDEMRSFDSTKMYSSAVLFKVDYEILAGSDKTFRIYATCPYTTEHLTENVFTVKKDGTLTDTYYSSVSNSVAISEASYDATNEKYTVISSSKTEAYNVKFIKSDYSKNFTKYLKTSIENTSTAENLKGTLYYVMDYDETLFSALTNSMLTTGGTLNSRITLDGDVIFGIEEYTLGTPTVESVTFVNSTSITTQAAGTDVMTASWQFLLEKSDDTLETVKYNETEFKVDENFSTTSTGNKKVTIKYGELTVKYQPAEGEATTEIPYKIEEATTVTGITLNKYTLSLIYNSSSETPATAQLTATVSPSTATNKTVIWESSNSNVAMVSSTGLVTATGAGTATITAKSDADNEISNTCTVTVTASSSATAVTGVTLDSKTLALVVNKPASGADKATLTATIEPENATNKDVTWTSSDPSVAIVDDSGNVTALTAGKTNITVTTSDGGFVAICSVIVTDYKSSVPVTSVSLNATELSLTVGGTETLKATISPSNATITTVSWDTSDNTVATVDDSGKVTALKAGTATITVTTKDGSHTATCTVNVTGSTTTKYTVTFDSNGKTATNMPEIQSIESGKTATQPTISPKSEGYLFVGWYKDDTCTTAFDFSTPINNNITLYAGWVVDSGTGGEGTTEYTVTFKNYDGTTLETDTGVLSGATPSYDGATPEKDLDTYNTYTFYGWSDGEQTYTSTLPAVTANVTYVAQFTAVPKSEGTVTYMYTYGGTNDTNVWGTTGLNVADASDDSPAVIGLKVGNTNGTSDIFSFNASGKKVLITMTGYSRGSSSSQSYVVVTFKNGSTTLGTLAGTTPAGKKQGKYTFNSATEGTFESTTAFTSIEFTCNTLGKSFAITSVTIIIEGESSGGTDPTSYTVTFMDGSNKLSESKVDYNTTVSKPDNPVKTGYTFSMWCSDEALTTEFNFTTEITADTIIYAKWTINKYSVTWKNYDGSTLETDTNVEYGATPTYDGEPPTKAAVGTTTYAFYGWSDGTNTYTTDKLPTVSDTVIYTAVFTESTSGGTTITVYDSTMFSSIADGGGTSDGALTINGGKFTERNEKLFTYEYKGQSYKSNSLRAEGSGRYISFKLNKGDVVTVIYSGNVKENTIPNANVAIVDSSGNTLSSGTATGGTIDYTATATGTYKITFDKNDCFAAIIIERVATTS